MRFFEFDDEFFEAAGSGATRSSSVSTASGGASRSVASGGASRSATSGGAPTSGRGGAGSAARTTPLSATGTAAGGRPRAGSSPAGPTSRAQTPSPNARPSGGGSSVLSSLASTVDRVTPYAQQAWDFAQHAPQVIQAAQQFAGAMGLDGQRPSGGDGATAAAQPGVPAPAVQPSPGGAPPSVEPVATAPPQMAPPYSGGLGQPGAGFDQIAMLLQALTQRQIPPLPAPAPPPAAAVAPVPAAAQPDAFALLRMILTNPQLQQALQSAPASATAAGARVVPLPVPSPAAPRQVRSVPIPLAAVMNAILALAGQSLTELHENVSEEEPEVPAYLVGDDGDFLVDPASDDDRAALVAHLFRLNEAAQRSGRYPQLNSRPGYAGAEQDESDEWARAAGFL